MHNFVKQLLSFLKAYSQILLFYFQTAKDSTYHCTPVLHTIRMYLLQFFLDVKIKVKIAQFNVSPRVRIVSSNSTCLHLGRSDDGDTNINNLSNTSGKLQPGFTLQFICFFTKWHSVRM